MIPAIVFKHPGAPGLRVFSDAAAAIQAGENPANLHAVAGMLVKWPSALGAPPDVATLTQWEAERIAFESQAPTNPETFTKREHALLLAAALLAGVNPASAKAQSKAAFQQAMGLL